MSRIVEKFFEDVYNKNYQAVSSFIQNGNDINVIHDGKTALHIACVKNDIDMVKHLLKAGSNPNIVVRNDTPLHIAIRTGNTDILKLLIENNAQVSMLNNSTPLYDACDTRNLDMMKILLEEGVNPDEVDFTGKPILNHVSQSGDEQDVKFVETLLKYGANPNIDDGEVGTALHNACDANNVSSIDRLLKYNASICQINNNGELPLHIACARNSANAVAMILKRNEGILKQGVYSLLAYYNKENNRDRKTPLQIARINNNNEIKDMLQERIKNAIVQCILNSKFGV